MAIFNSYWYVKLPEGISGGNIWIGQHEISTLVKAPIHHWPVLLPEVEVQWTDLVGNPHVTSTIFFGQTAPQFAAVLEQ